MVRDIFVAAFVGLGIDRLLVAGHVVASQSGAGSLAILGALLSPRVVQMYAEYRSSKRTEPRPRAHYVIFCLAFLVAAVAAAAVGGWAGIHHMALLATAMLWAVVFSLTGVVVTFGRGVVRGRIRRVFWRVPPPWLDREK